MIIACVDGGLFCGPLLLLFAFAGWGLHRVACRASECEDHCDHCPGDHDS